MAKDDNGAIKEAREAFQLAHDSELHNRETYIEDTRFAREGKQWPDHVVKQRELEGRPILTINRLPTFIRQVVNDARQNKPSIHVHPADSGADKKTAEIINGLIRNIEYTSNADVAYDTAIECAVTGGFGYFRIGLDYQYSDSFDMDLTIQRVANPLSIYGDPNSSAADSSDWNVAFVTERLSKKQFERLYPDAEMVDWDDDSWSGDGMSIWRPDEDVIVAEYWRREEVEKDILLLSNNMVVAAEEFENDPDLQALRESGLVEVLNSRKAKGHKVTQTFMSGAEILAPVRDWPGCYIPIVPVYGDEFNIEGKRYFRSLVHNGIDAQRMFNYWRTNATELVALAPRVPFIGRKGTFDSDIEKWQTANTQSHPFIEYDIEPPQRQPLDMGAAAGSLQEALNAAEDLKATIGLFDASLGAKSNETSGRAIMARQREGDVSTFHFMDNMARAIRHAGRIIIDLIPKVYNGPRIIRIMGEDGKEEAVPINQEYEAGADPKTGEAIIAMHDFNTGRYDLTVKTGPSFTTRREEAAMQMTEMLRAFPQAAPIIGPELAKNLDWPGADKIAEKLEAMTSGQVPPEVQQQIEEGAEELKRLKEENERLKADQQAEMAKLQAQMQIESLKVTNQKDIETLKIQSNEQIARAKIDSEAKIDAYKAELTARAQASRPIVQNYSRQG